MKRVPPRVPWVLSHVSHVFLGTGKDSLIPGALGAVATILPLVDALVADHLQFHRAGARSRVERWHSQKTVTFTNPWGGPKCSVLGVVPDMLASGKAPKKSQENKRRRSNQSRCGLGVNLP